MIHNCIVFADLEHLMFWTPSVDLSAFRGYFSIGYLRRITCLKIGKRGRGKKNVNQVFQI
jgi:hypothetical protein